MWGVAMIKYFLVAIGILCFASPCFGAPSLGCDLPPSGTVITQTKVQMQRGTEPATEVDGTAIVQGINFVVLDLAGFTPGKYVFKIRWATSSSLWSDYSDPFPVEKPAKAGGVRIIP